VATRAAVLLVRVACSTIIEISRSLGPDDTLESVGQRLRAYGKSLGLGEIVTAQSGRTQPTEGKVGVRW
jgi:hypothetical protein